MKTGDYGNGEGEHEQLQSDVVQPMSWKWSFWPRKRKQVSRVHHRIPSEFVNLYRPSTAWLGYSTRHTEIAGGYLPKVKMDSTMRMRLYGTHESGWSEGKAGRDSLLRDHPGSRLARQNLLACELSLVGAARC